MTCALVCVVFFFKTEAGIRDLVRSRGLGDVYKRQRPGRDRPDSILDLSGGQHIQEPCWCAPQEAAKEDQRSPQQRPHSRQRTPGAHSVGQPANHCLLYTSDAADEQSSVDLGGRRIIKKKKPPQDNATPTLRPRRSHQQGLHKRDTTTPEHNKHTSSHTKLQNKATKRISSETT